MRQHRIVLCETGGTFSMGMVSGKILKNLNYSGVIDSEKYDIPLFDIRHFALAAKIVSSSFSEDEKNSFLVDLVETSQNFIIEEKMTKNPSKQHNDFLQHIVEKISAHNSVQGLLEEFHLSSSLSKPYTIDSIDFIINDHYPSLLNASIQAFNQPNTTLIVIGGTDTLEFYAGLLGRDLNRRGFFCPEKGNKIIFLSSMLGFGYDTGLEISNSSKAIYPAHIGKYILSALRFSQENQNGAFSMAAEDKSVSKVRVHDILGNFVKISSSSDIPNALRSSNEIGHIDINHNNVTFFKSDLFIPRKFSCHQDNNQLIQLKGVSPPIIKSDIQTLSVILRGLSSYPHSFQSVMIEINKELLIEVSNNKRSILDISKSLEKIVNSGVEIIWFNEASFNQKTGSIATQYDLRELKEFASFQSIFLNKNNVKYIENNTLIGAYLDQIIQNPIKISNTLDSIMDIKEKIPVLGIKYIPDDKLFREMLQFAGKISRSVVISALPGETIPEKHLNLIEGLINNKTEVYLCFKYNGMHHNFSNNSFIEGAQTNDYAAAQCYRNLVENKLLKRCEVLSPDQMIYQIRKTNSFYLEPFYSELFQTFKSSFMLSLASKATEKFVSKIKDRESGELAGMAVAVAIMHCFDYSTLNVAIFIGSRFLFHLARLPKQYINILSCALTVYSFIMAEDKEDLFLNIITGIMASVLANPIGSVWGEAAANCITPQRTNEHKPAGQIQGDEKMMARAVGREKIDQPPRSTKVSNAPNIFTARKNHKSRHNKARPNLNSPKLG